MVALVLCGHVSAYYGVRYDPKRPAANRTISTFVPENGSVFRMTQPDGVVRRVYRDRETQTFISAAPWMCESDESNNVCVRTEPGFPKGETAFFFRGGLLERLLLDGKFYPYQQPSVSGTNAIPALWAKAHTGMIDEVMSGKDIWIEGDRFRFRFGRFINPNTTAALLVELALLASALIVCRRKWLQVLGFAALLPSLWFLQRTLSRGGLLAFAAGLVLILVFRLRGMFTWRRFAVGAVVLLLAVGGLLAGVLARGDVKEKGFFAQDDRTSRTVIWRAVPQMMVSAPAGWGSGNVGRAYVDWFQPEDYPVAIADMVSGHLTRLVEFGWGMRFGYLFLWLAVLAVSVYGAWRGGSPLPVAMWVAFGVADSFSNLDEEPLLWCIPALTLLLVPFRELVARKRHVLLALVGVAVLTGLFLAGFALVGVVVNRSSIRIHALDDGGVAINGTTPDVWLVGDETVLDGGYQVYFGKEIRAHFKAYRDAPVLGYLRDVEKIPETAHRVILAGRSGEEFLKRWRESPRSFDQIRDVVFLSPPFTWKHVPPTFLSEHKVSLGVGALAARLSPDYDNPPDWVDVVPESELYLLGWTEWINASPNGLE